MDCDEILNQACELYEAKLRTGEYDGYDERARDILFEDCVRQAATTAEINRIAEANRKNPNRFGTPDSEMRSRLLGAASNAVEVREVTTIRIQESEEGKE